MPSLPRPSASLLLVNKNDEVSDSPSVRQIPKTVLMLFYEQVMTTHSLPGVDDSTNTIHQELCRDAREPLVVSNGRE